MKTIRFWALLLLAALLVDNLAGQNGSGDRVPVKGRKTPVLDDGVYNGRDVVRKVNMNTKKKFEAREYERFDGMTNKDLKQLLGAADYTVQPTDANVEVTRAKRQSFSYPPNLSTYVFPTEFDASTKWPKCSSIINQVQDQGLCASCWAVATAAAISDRRCIFYNGTSLMRISAWDILGCAIGSNGCKGGYSYDAFKWYVTTGVVTGGDYPSVGTSQAYCKPYLLSPNQTTPTAISCNTTCQYSYRTRYSSDKRRGQTYYYITYEDKAVMWELMNRGPVVATMDVYADFYSYSSGIYSRTSSSYYGAHAIRLVGWGVSNGTKFWKAANSWGSSWGEGGFFRIRRDAYESNFDYYYATAATVKS